MGRNYEGKVQDHFPAVSIAIKEILQSLKEHEQELQETVHDVVYHDNELRNMRNSTNHRLYKPWVQ
eukprot:15366955-Ditylum_brightwellii.AAC.1